MHRSKACMNTGCIRGAPLFRISNCELVLCCTKVSLMFCVVCRCAAPKGATFGLFPPDAPSAEAHPVPRERLRASSDSAVMSSVLNRKRLLPPTPDDVQQPAGNGTSSTSPTGTKPSLHLHTHVTYTGQRSRSPAVTKRRHRMRHYQ